MVDFPNWDNRNHPLWGEFVVWLAKHFIVLVETDPNVINVLWDSYLSGYELSMRIALSSTKDLFYGKEEAREFIEKLKSIDVVFPLNKKESNR
jgi:hypothetical protein